MLNRVNLASYWEKLRCAVIEWRKPVVTNRQKLFPVQARSGWFIILNLATDSVVTVMPLPESLQVVKAIRFPFRHEYYALSVDPSIAFDGFDSEHTVTYVSPKLFKVGSLEELSPLEVGRTILNKTLLSQTIDPWWVPAGLIRHNIKKSEQIGGYDEMIGI